MLKLSPNLFDLLDLGVDGGEDLVGRETDEQRQDHVYPLQEARLKGCCVKSDIDMLRYHYDIIMSKQSKKEQGISIQFLVGRA